MDAIDWFASFESYAMNANKQATVTKECTRETPYELD